MLTLGSYLDDFFCNEKCFLLSQYPGLTINRLKSEIFAIGNYFGIESENLFDSAYIIATSNPFTQFFEKLKKGIPLEYISGMSYFYQANFFVNSNVLIPRNETEILVELAIIEINKKFKNKKCKAIDIGTGSGAIALSILMGSKDVELNFLATDISPEALYVAKKNYKLLEFLISKKHTLDFQISDRLNNVIGSFDYIFTNPPYIKQSDKKSVHDQVLKFEPHLALFLDDEKYDNWFKEFFKSIQSKLNSNGVCFMEGHEDHLEGLHTIAKNLEFNEVQLIKDYTHRNRFLKLTK